MNGLVLITILIAIVAAMLIFVILIQNSKGGGLDATFGAGQANQMFGAAKSTDFVEKATWFLAAALFILCILATYAVGGGSGGETELLSQ